MAVQVRGWFSSLLSRLFLIIEPLAPRYISYNLRRKLKKWERDGLILGYRTRTRRLERLHYQIAIDMDLTPDQTTMILRELSNQTLHAPLESIEEVMLWLRRRRVTLR